MPRDATATREALIVTAERLMAEHGPDAVSLREVSARSGQGNHNAAQYHFGSREGLIEAVLQHRMGPIAEHRASMFAALADDASLRDLVRTIVVPLADASQRHPHYVGFFSQLRVSRRYSYLVAYQRTRTHSFQEVRDQIHRRLPEPPSRVKEQRLWLCGTLMVHALAEYVAAPDAQPYKRVGDIIDGIVEACLAILEAP